VPRVFSRETVKPVTDLMRSIVKEAVSRGIPLAGALKRRKYD